MNAVKGRGQARVEGLKRKGIETVEDILLTVPLRYEDRSERALLTTANLNQTYTFEAKVEKKSQQYKGRRSIQRAVISDKSGKRPVIWFNNAFIIDKLQVGEWFLFSGKINDRGQLTQLTVEDIKSETINTDRIIPLYCKTMGMKVGSLRRIFKRVLYHLHF